jgi:glycosyltransferase involved in cell wall biosynthesis
MPLSSKSSETTAAAPRLSVIIPARNEAANLGRCLQALRTALSGYAHSAEIILVDNGSTDATVEIARASACRVITEPSGTIGHLRNVGVHAARGEIIAFLDADCLVPPTWISSCLGRMGPDIGIVGTWAVPDPNDHTWVEQAFYRLLINSTKGEFLKWIGTANCFVRKTDFEDARGFDESLLAGEDVAFSNLIRKAGKRICVLKSPATIHLRESKTLGQLLVREFQRGKSSLRSLAHSSQFLQEIPSIALPAFFIATVVLAILLSVMHPNLGAFFLAILCLWPIAVLLKRKLRTKSFREFSQCYAVAATYIIARTSSLFYELFYLTFSRRR